VRFAVEVAVGEHVADLVDGIVVEKKTAKHRLLRFERMRRELQAVDLRIVWHRRGDSRLLAVAVRGRLSSARFAGNAILTVCDRASDILLA